MKIHQRLLKFIDPKGEQRRRDYRECLAHTCAEAEDLTRTIRMNGFEFHKLLEASKPDGSGRGS